MSGYTYDHTYCKKRRKMFKITNSYFQLRCHDNTDCNKYNFTVKVALQATPVQVEFTIIRLSRCRCLPL